jgi:predicted dehydrogenase
MTGRGNAIRVGILGCSDIARRRFLPGVLSARNAVLVACSSRNIEKARQFFPGARYESMGYDDLLSSAAIDVVYISLPNHLHEEWALRALEQGKHVICEKPLGLSAASVAAMTAYAGQRGLLLSENIMYLHHPLHAEARRIVARGDIGRLKAMRSSFGFFLADPGFRLSVLPGGGAFHDQARYPLSAALFHLHGEFVRFTGHALFRNGVNVGLNACGITSAGESMYFSMGFEQQYECWYELIGDRGLLRVMRAFTTPSDQTGVIEVTAGPDVTRVEVPATDHFQLMIEHVAGMIERRQGFAETHQRARKLAAAADLLWSGCERVDLEG